ncbi:response regulator [Pseudooceanicola sp. 216_PA32_1]|uniref:Response regulator n=1 Tax=Pseudooceanicola pacificus TaxID=2676438 RepID=A0A844WBM8_9RHOB|nr:response regulator [Pseudooceanicola pacificus]MWB77392.1 response regulator [Pseudooceanicola pacificus]
MTVTWTPSGKRILYLEDEAIIALDTAEMLREIGFHDIDLCHSLEMAEAALGSARPDVALLDVNLSHGRTSIELGNQLLEAGVPVIFATGYSASSLPVDPRARVLEKPVAADVLFKTLRQAAS